uniref:AlNc14C425G11553 protein n=1 Tax=Albugo laibachii Nc14 TaxID=890382 RepID=F0WZF1_9STRA|nr:AlNc14C425G11553 [Albugo laibachii Nc14]|eukprot:CCA26871.1 AlNc14C425G11553 [Albugo laibachii Nc14]
MQDGAFFEVYKIKIYLVAIKKAPSFLQPLLSDFSDVFPDRLPDKLPPERSIKLELHMKMILNTKCKGTYRLSKIEQDALEEFVKLRKGWIEVFNSPRVSSIFGVPKKFPATNTIPKRSE